MYPTSDVPFRRQFTPRRRNLLAMFALFAGVNVLWGEESGHSQQHFGIHVVEKATARGIPLVTLRTVNDVAYVTDSAGWTAIAEPDLAGRDVFFHIESPGYEIAQDGFGFRGKRLTVVPGETTTVTLRRSNIAERLYRVTGQGIYRDTKLLGREPPIKLPQGGAEVVGQDSVQAVRYRDKIFWLWGDTNLASYPLGNYQVTAATSDHPRENSFQPGQGVPLNYFVDEVDPTRVRKMMPLTKPGAVWLFGLVNINGPDGKDTLLAHYSRQRQLGRVLEHGLARFDEEAGIFKRVLELPLEERWRFPRGNAVSVTEGDTEFIYFCQSFANVRVRATWHAIVDPSAYESLAWSLEEKAYRWQRETGPTTQQQEGVLINAEKMPRNAARYQLRDVNSEDSIIIHRASINWNPFRRKWILIGNQAGKRGEPSYLGEVYYAEGETATGPWTKAIKIATHPRYSFYNPRHHVFLDEQDGRVIYFEGTYTRMFSASTVSTPRYDYNQLMYRLDLNDERLEAVQR